MTESNCRVRVGVEWWSWYMFSRMAFIEILGRPDSHGKSVINFHARIYKVEMQQSNVEMFLIFLFFGE